MAATIRTRRFIEIVLASRFMRDQREMVGIFVACDTANVFGVCDTANVVRGGAISAISVLKREYRDAALPIPVSLGRQNSGTYFTLPDGCNMEAKVW
jgi:hypothetical protein